MKYIEALKLALQSLWANKLRSVLTLFGVIIGVGSVIMVVTLAVRPQGLMGKSL